MFVAILKITAEIQEDEQGQRIFKILADQPLGSNLKFLVSTAYYQDMYRILQAGDTLTVTFQSPKTVRQIVANFRHDELWSYAFEVEGHQPTPDLFPIIEPVYEETLQALQPGDTCTITYHVQRQ